MTPLQWILLCVLFTLYLLFGGSIFMYFEQHREIEKKEEISVLRKDIKEILVLLDRNFYNNETNRETIHALTLAKLEVIHRISAVCDVGDLVSASDFDEGSSSTTQAPSKGDQPDDKLKWNFYNSVFFAFTVITTIGYGHLSPSTKWSKCFVMIYALIGIPINSILLSGLGDYFSSRLVKVHKKSKEKPERNCSVVFEILFYLIPGMIIFMIIPAVIFAFIESWTFLDSFYYAFVSLTTIGFGDYVAGMGNGHTVWMWIYKAFIIIWITFGLGYLIMILGFISKGMTHKKLRVVIEKRINNIRFTKDKLSRDIDYMRRVVNELYLMKIKPVYEDSSEEEDDFKVKAKRTQSQPCITSLGRRHSSFPQLPVTVGPDNDGVKFIIGESKSPKLTRRCSESDLKHIDRDKTFESAIRNQVTVDELLVSVINALSGNVMHEVMEAVEELNEYEQEHVMEGDSGAHHGEDGEVAHANVTSSRLNHSKSNDSLNRSNNSLHRSRNNSYSSLHDRMDFDDHPPWELGALSESDEEVLIGDDENDNLQQVVVHGEVNKSSSSSVMDKVSGVMRKISSGSRTSEGPSRKVSRNDSFRRKISRNDSFEPHSSAHYPPRPYLNPMAHSHSHSHMYERKSSQRQRRKISEESKTSNISARSRLTDAPSAHGYGSNASSRKISPTQHHVDDDGRQKMTLESTSLAEFLQALDNVHSRLHSKSSVTSFGGDSSTYSDNQWEDRSNQLPIVRRSTRRKTSAESYNGMDNPNSRRRKNGITHPDFAYANDNFVHDETDDEEIEKPRKESSKHRDSRKRAK